MPRQPNSSRPPKTIRKGKLMSIESIEIGLLMPKANHIIKKRHALKAININPICSVILLPNAYLTKRFFLKISLKLSIDKV